MTGLPLTTLGGRKTGGVSRIKIACIGGCPKRQRGAKGLRGTFLAGLDIRLEMLPTETRCGWDGPPKWRCNDLWLLASGRDASRRAVCVLGRRWWVVVMEGGKVGGGGWWEVTSPATHRLLWSLLVAIDFGDPEVAPTTTGKFRSKATGVTHREATSRRRLWTPAGAKSH